MGGGGAALYRRKRSESYTYGSMGDTLGGVGTARDGAGGGVREGTPKEERSRSETRMSSDFGFDDVRVAQ